MKYLPIVLMLSSALIFSGCGKEEKPAPPPTASSAPAPQIHEIAKESVEIYQKALSAYGSGDHKTALKLAEEALSKDRENYKALSLKGIIEAFDSSPEKGIETIKKSLAIHPDYTQAFFDMAMAQKLSKHYDESIRYFQKVIAKDPQNTWSYYGIATNYADKRDKARALEYLKKALSLDPQHVRPEAATQDHFLWLHGDKDFEALLK